MPRQPARPVLAPNTLCNDATARSRPVFGAPPPPVPPPARTRATPTQSRAGWPSAARVRSAWLTSGLAAAAVLLSMVGLAIGPPGPGPRGLARWPCTAIGGVMTVGADLVGHPPPSRGELTMAVTAPRTPARRRSLPAGILGVIAVLAIFLATLVGSIHAVVLSPDTLTTSSPLSARARRSRPRCRRRPPRASSTGSGWRPRRSRCSVRAWARWSRPRSVRRPRTGWRARSRMRSRRRSSPRGGSRSSTRPRPRRSTCSRATARPSPPATARSTSTCSPPSGARSTRSRRRGSSTRRSSCPTSRTPAAPAPVMIARLSSLLGLSLPADFGQVPIAHTAALEQAQGLVATLDRVTVLLIVVAVALAAAAVALAGDRRRMVVLIGVWSALLVAAVPPLLHVAANGGRRSRSPRRGWRSWWARSWTRSSARSSGRSGRSRRSASGRPWSG